MGFGVWGLEFVVEGSRGWVSLPDGREASRMSAPSLLLSSLELSDTKVYEP